jgi:hypothetical protein
VSDPKTRAGRELLLHHRDLAADEIVELERQAHGQGIHAERERVQRLVDGLRHVLTPEQLGAASAVLSLDPDVIATLDEATLRFVLDGLVRMPNPGPEERAAAQEASRRYLDEIM